MLFGMSGYEGVLFGKDAYDAAGDFLVNDCLVVFLMTLMPNPYPK